MNNNISDITKDFYKIYYDLIILKDESIFINDLLNMSNNYKIIDFIKILDVKKLIFHLKDLNLLLCHKILLLLYIKSDLNNKLFYFSDSQKSDNIIYIVENIKNKLDYLNAFTSSINIPDDIETDTNNKHLIYWYEECKLEIINRIELLYNYFNKVFFKKFNIKMILKSTLYNDDFDNIMTYHNYIIEKIKNILNKHLKLCDAYIEIEKSLVLTIISQDISVKLHKYELIIVDDDSNSES